MCIYICTHATACKQRQAIMDQLLCNLISHSLVTDMECACLHKQTSLYSQSAVLLPKPVVVHQWLRTWA